MFLAATSHDLTANITLFGLLLLSLGVHEFGHAYVATALGDPTSERLGRKTLNPIAHLDPLYSIALPAYLIFFSGTGYLFGAGKPVPVDTRYLRRPHRDMLLISSAGPAMNVALALALTAMAWVLTHSSIGTSDSMSDAVGLGIRLNLLLAIFNLLPVPPLDGHRVLGFFLPPALRERFYRAQWLLLVLMLLLFLPSTNFLWSSLLEPLLGWWRSALMPADWPWHAW